IGQSIAGTLEYAAPEQMGRLPGVGVTFASDVYGFGKTMCYALFATPNLSYQDWKQIEGPLADLLGRCVAERPERRPANFDVVLRALEPLVRPARPAKGVPVRPEPPKVLDAQPLDEAIPVARAAEDEVKVEVVKPGSKPGRAKFRRGKTDCGVLYNGHEVTVSVNVWTNQAVVCYDGRQVASGFPMLNGHLASTVREGGQRVDYRVLVRGVLNPSFMVLRGDEVLYDG